MPWCCNPAINGLRFAIGFVMNSESSGHESDRAAKTSHRSEWTRRGAMSRSIILHPVQYSAGGRHATAQALALAQSRQSDLHLVHVRSRRESRDEETAEQLRLRTFVTDSDEKQVSFQAVILYGDPVRAVADYAQSIAPDLIVVGNTGRPGSTLWRPGAYAKELATLVNCPTLMVPADEHRPNRDAEFSFENILCATDFSDAASAALKQALLF